MSRNRTLYALFIVLIPIAAAAQEEPPAIPEPRRWTIGFRLGDYSSSESSRRWWDAARVTAGIEFTRRYTPKTAFSFGVDAMTSTGRHAALVPITATYKVFPAGNGLMSAVEQAAPLVRPWIGGGAGLYVHEPEFHWAGGDTVDAGAHAAAGLVIPIGRRFEIDGELRYTVMRDLHVVSYMMGIGIRL